MIEVQLDLVGLGAGGFVACELELLDQVFVGDLGKTTAFVSIQVDIINEKRAAGKGARGHGSQAGVPSAGAGVPVGGPVAIADVAKFKVNFNLMVL